MKKVLSLVLVLTLCAVLVSVPVFAANLPTYAPDNEGKYSVPYTEGTSGYYYALLVVEGIYDVDETPVISEDTVLYIDQATANADGDVSFDGWIPKNDEPATVYLGGVANGPVLLGYLGANNFVVAGTVTTDSSTTYEATVTLTDAEGFAYTGTSVNGAYTVEVPEGNYTFVVNVKNHLSYTDNDFAVTGDVSGKNVAVKGGDINSNGSVDYEDFAAVVNNFLLENEAADINGNGTIDYEDYAKVVNNFGIAAVVE